MEQKPVLEAVIPSVAGSAVIRASFPVTQTVGTLGVLTDVLEFEIQVVDITSTSATVTAQTSIGRGLRCRIRDGHGIRTAGR